MGPERSAPRSGYPLGAQEGADVAKKKAAAAAEEVAEAVEGSLDARQAERAGEERSGVNILPADLEVLEKPIDDRMAALLKDHQRMGARP